MNKSEPDIVTEAPFAALVGIDWADKKHDVCLYEVDTGTQTSCVIEHTPEALMDWIAKLQTAYCGRRIAISLEQFRGGLISALLSYEFITLYPVNPATLAKYREAFAPSRAKDDPSDAKLLMELLLKHRDKLKAWQPDDEKTRTLSLLNEERRKTVDERTRLVQRLRAVLKGYFPQAIDLLADNVKSTTACDFIQKWPTLDAAKRARPKTIRAFYYAHNYRRGDLIEANIEAIRSAVPLMQDRAVLNTSVLTATLLAKQIRVANAAIDQYDQQILALYEEHPDAFIFESLPGSGKSLGPRLLAAMGTNRDRYKSAVDIQTYSGIAPVTERSGKYQWIHWRWGCPTFMRQSFHEFATFSRRSSLWAKAFYDLQRERGKSHHAAIRSLAFKWQRVIFRCWKDRQAYSEEHYIQSLRDNGSPLWPRIQALQEAC